MDTIQKFNGKAINYSKYRPHYPETFIDYLYTNIGFNKNSTIADIGSGTGILTYEFLNRGSKVFGIEPNNDMREIAEEKLKMFVNFSSLNTTAENTKLPQNSIDFITAAQAFHWFDTDDFKIECNRIIKNNAKIVLVWNKRVENQKLLIEHEKINYKYCPNFNGFNGCLSKLYKEIDNFYKRNYDIKVFRNNIIVNYDEFIGGSLSASYSLTEKDHKYEEYIYDLTKLFKKFAKSNKLSLKNETVSYIGMC